MNLKENIVTELRNAIVSGEYKSGDHLTETALSLRFGASRTPIREALNRMEKEGFIKITPGKGARVVKLSLKDISDIYDMLIVLEGLACKLACNQLTDEQIGKLEQLYLKTMKASGRKNLDLMSELNIQFHWIITEATSNSYLIDVRFKFRNLIDQFGRISYLVPGQIKATLVEHQKIIDAFKRRNPTSAELLTKKHLENGKKRVLKYLSKRQEESNRDNRSRNIRRKTSTRLL
jgi:DNA-binding GntR family transcriptional regulator